MMKIPTRFEDSNPSYRPSGVPQSRPGKRVQDQDLRGSSSDPAESSPRTLRYQTLDEVLIAVERREILAALTSACGSRTAAAHLLKISRSRLYRRISALKLGGDLRAIDFAKGRARQLGDRVVRSRA